MRVLYNNGLFLILLVYQAGQRMDKNNERKGMHIIESVINMTKTMAMPVIVEAVETQEQCGHLMDLVIVDADYVDDELGDVKCILSMTKK